MVMVTMTSTKQELMLQLVKIAKQMIPLEEKIKMEQEARENQINPSHDPVTGRFTPVSDDSSPTGEMSRKVAKQIAKKAGVHERTVYHSVATPGSTSTWDICCCGAV